MSHPYHDGFAVLAHRGGLASHENSLTAFQQAHELGVRFFETDVHATKDGVLIAFHDDRLDRVTNASGRIKDLTWAEVARARISGTEPIPRFAELLDAFPDAYFNVDLKATAAIGPLAGLCEKSDRIRDQLCVTSFSAQRLRDFRNVTFGQVATSTSWPGILANVLGLPVPGPAIAYQVPVSYGRIQVVTRKFIDRAHAQGRLVHVWTINDPTEMERLIDLGVDGIVTDEPQTLLTVLADRN